MKKNLMYLLIVGLLLICYAGGYSYIEGGFDLFPVVSMICGVVCIVFFGICKSQETMMLIKKRPFKKSLMMFFVSLLFVVVYIEVNYLGVKFDRKWDVTELKQHTLSESTIKYIQSLNQKIELTAFYVGIPPKYLEDLLNEYTRQAKGNISFEIIDPIVDIGYAAKFGNVISGKENKIIVLSESDRRDVDFSSEPLSEEQITNAILRVTSRGINAYFLVGHKEFNISDKEETGLSIFKQLLSANNIMSRKLFLGSTGKIPDDCDVLIIAGPHKFLEVEEVLEIRKYLRKGGDALILVEHTLVTTPDKPLKKDELLLNPSMNEILIDWGLRVGNDVVVDLSSHAGDDVGSPATKRYMKHESITKGLGYSFFVRPRSMSVIKKRRPTIKLAPIVITESDENSWAEKDRMLRIHFDESIDTPGPISFSYVAWEGREDDKPSDTRLIVFTDADFITNAFIGQYSNAELGLNLVKWLSELDYQVFLDKKEIKIEKLDLTSKQRRRVAAVLFVIPLLIILKGVFVWMRFR